MFTSTIPFPGLRRPQLWEALWNIQVTHIIDNIYRWPYTGQVRGWMTVSNAWRFWFQLWRLFWVLQEEHPQEQSLHLQGDRDSCQQCQWSWHVNDNTVNDDHGENVNLMTFKYFPIKAAAELKGRCPIDKTHRNQVFFSSSLLLILLISNNNDNITFILLILLLHLY